MWASRSRSIDQGFAIRRFIYNAVRGISPAILVALLSQIGAGGCSPRGMESRRTSGQHAVEPTQLVRSVDAVLPIDPITGKRFEWHVLSQRECTSLLKVRMPPSSPTAADDSVVEALARATNKQVIWIPPLNSDEINRIRSQLRYDQLIAERKEPPTVGEILVQLLTANTETGLHSQSSVEEFHSMSIEVAIFTDRYLVFLLVPRS
jgi:hypothetical protein